MWIDSVTGPGTVAFTGLSVWVLRYVKSFYVETPEDVAERLRRCLAFIPAEKLSAIPDCGFFPVPRWLAAEKLKRLVAGTKLVRRELTGRT